MKDSYSDERLKLLHPKARSIFEFFIDDCEKSFNTTFRIAQGFRTFEEQTIMYNQGRTTPGNIVTNSKAGQSYHNYGMSIDIVEMIKGVPNWSFDYAKLLPTAKKYNLGWGGLFNSPFDLPHYQYIMGYSWQQLLEKYKAKDFIYTPLYVNI